MHYDRPSYYELDGALGDPSIYTNTVFLGITRQPRSGNVIEMSPWSPVID